MRNSMSWGSLSQRLVIFIVEGQRQQRRLARDRPSIVRHSLTLYEVRSLPHQRGAYGKTQASRSSVFFGRRPDTVGVFSLQSSPRTGMCADCITLPDLFRARGWRPCPGDLADALGSIARKCMAEDVAGRPGFDEVSNALLCC